MFVARQAAAALTLIFLTLWGASTASASANCSEASFRLPQSFDMVSTPFSFVAADLNGDGRPDLAATGANGVEVRLNDGTGWFDVPTRFDTGRFPAGLDAGDFNGDGRTDLMVANSERGAVSLLLGNGAGGFGAPVNIAIGTRTISVHAADFNNDGKTDVAVGDIGSGNPDFVYVLLGDGAGNFTRAGEVTVDGFPDSFASADFNKDGKLDLALRSGQRPLVLFGDGAGGFAPPLNVLTDGVLALDAADLNGDGNPDLAAALRNDGISLLFGNGAGGFSAPALVPTGPSSVPVQVTAADFDGDGKTDLAAILSGSSSAAVLLGDGAGGFGAPRAFSASVVPRHLAAADFNGDGANDLAVSKDHGVFFGSSPGFIIMLGVGDGDFHAAPALPANTSGSAIFPQKGTGLFGAPTTYAVGERSTSAVSADFNGDGIADMAIPNEFSEGVSVLTGNADGTFRPRVVFLTDGPVSQIVADDFNADGKTDLAVTHTTAHRVALLLNNLTTPLPCLSVGDATFAEGDAGEDAAEFTVTLSEPSVKTVKVSYFPLALLADFNQDFRATPGSLTFAPGTTSQKIRVAVIGDVIDEDSETLRITLRSPANALISDGVAVGNILDNDPGPTISVADAAAAEGTFSTNLSFNVTLSTPSTRTITVKYVTSPGIATETPDGDYLPASGTLTFGAGQTSQIVNVNVRGDNVRESDETFTLSLSEPTNAFIGDGTAQGVILNDDPVPALRIETGSTTESPAGSAITVRVRMSNPTDQTVTVAYATADVTAAAGSDYVAASGTLTFGPGEVEKSFAVAAIDDTEDEPFETFNVSLSNPTNATVAAGLGVYRIFDNDGPAISINDMTIAEGQSGRTLASFTLSLSAPSPEAVAVRVATANGTATGGGFPSDYVPIGLNGLVIFPAGSTTATLAVLVNGDQIIEPDETFFVNLSQPSGGTIADAQGLGTITNDDTTSVQFSTDALTANEADGSVQVTVQRVGDLSGVFDAFYITFDGTASQRSDYNASLGTLRFEPGETTKTITVFVTNDALIESAENFFITLSGAGGGETNSPSAMTITLNSDDAAPGQNPIDDSAFFV
ncbi:MAG: Calx-beta domain-containing protein, partial [Pyrinomonadaceae bacterium]